MACSLTALLCSATFAGPRTPAQELLFAPSAGSRVTREIRESTRWNLKNWKRLRNGIDMGEVPPAFHGTSTLLLRYTDHYINVMQAQPHRARPLQLKRSLDEISGEFDLVANRAGENEAQSFEWSSPYAGWQLELAWIPAEEYYRVYKQGEQIELLTLASRADLSPLLPLQPSQLKPGSTWSLGGQTLFEIFRPCGELLLTPKTPARGPFRIIQPLNMGTASALTLREFGRGLSGAPKLSWKENTLVDGSMHARVELELELDVDSDNTRAFERLIIATGLDPDRNELTMRSVGKLKGKGELLWDLQRKRASALQLDLSFELRTSVTWFEESGMGEVSVSIEAELDGASDLRWTLKEPK